MNAKIPSTTTATARSHYHVNASYSILMTLNGFLDSLTVVNYLSTGHSLVDLEDAQPLRPLSDQFFFIFMQFST